MSHPREINAFQTLSRSVGSPLGAFHRSNAALMVAALLIHCGTLATVWLGDEGALALALVAALAAISLIGLVAALGTVRHQTRAALRRGGWDELLVTPLSDREIVNGQLMLAMRPFFSLAWIAAPSPIVLVLLLAWSALENQSAAEAWEVAAVGVLLTAAALLVMGLVIYVLCIGAFLRAFAGRRRIADALIGTVQTLAVCAVAIALTAFVFPFAWMILVAFAWMQHRTLCVSVRARLLEGR